MNFTSSQSMLFEFPLEFKATGFSVNITYCSLEDKLCKNYYL